MTDDLVLKNLGLVRWAVSRMNYRPLELEDAIGYGHVGLLKAAQTFDPDLGQFSTHAVPFIRGAVLTERRRILGRYNAKPRPISLEAMAGDGAPFDVSDPSPLEPDLGSDGTLALMEKLNEREQKIVRLHVMRGASLTKIAKDFEISTSRACQIYNRALKKLRRAHAQMVAA